jgi:hypothetical protein
MNKSLLAFAAGCIVGLILGIASDDFRARAASDEVMACKDEPDKKAYYARLPGEAHTVERCVKMIRFGSPNWIPEFQHPLQRKPK